MVYYRTSILRNNVEKDAHELKRMLGRQSCYYYTCISCFTSSSSASAAMLHVNVYSPVCSRTSDDPGGVLRREREMEGSLSSVTERVIEMGDEGERMSVSSALEVMFGGRLAAREDRDQ